MGITFECITITTVKPLVGDQEWWVRKFFRGKLTHPALIVRIHLCDHVLTSHQTFPLLVDFSAGFGSMEIK